MSNTIEKSYFVNVAKAYSGNADTFSNILQGKGDVIDISALDIETIKGGLFSESTASKILLPDTITDIGTECFSNAKNLEYVNLDNLKIFPYYLFNNCINLKYIGNCKPEIVESYAFSSCVNLYGKVDFSETIIMNNPGNGFTMTYTDVPKLQYSGDNVLRYSDYAPDTLIYLGRSNDNTSYDYLENNVYYKKNSQIDNAWVTKIKSGSSDIEIKDGTIGIADDSISSRTFNSIKFPQSIEYISGFGNSSNVNKFYIPSLEWWFSKDFFSRNKYLKDIAEEKPAPKECITTNFYWPNKYRLYDYDGNPLDDMTELNVPAEAGARSLSSFVNLKKITFNIPDYMSVPSDGYFPSIAGYFSNRGTSEGLVSSTDYKVSSIYNTKSELIFGYNISDSMGASGQTVYMPKLEEVVINSKKLASYVLPAFKYIKKLVLNVEEITTSIVLNSSNGNSSNGYDLVLNGTKTVSASSFGQSGMLLNLDLQNTTIKTIPYAFVETGYLVSVSLPITINKLEGYSFWSSSPNFNTINYPGTKEQWLAIEKDNDWNSGMYGNVIIYCSDGNLDKYGREV